MSGYDEKDIQVLEGLEPVRKRPGMYIGGTGPEGYHHLLWEIVDNAVDEAMNGHATTITVTLHADGRSATVTDNGRGIPVGLHPKLKKPTLEVILTTLHSGGKFEAGSYKTSGGLHGVGSSVVNALSEELVAIVKRDGFEWRQSFRRGKPRGPMEKAGEARGSGTTIRFRPDPEVFGDQLAFDPDTVRERLEITAYLHRGLRIVYKDEGRGTNEELKAEGGIRDYVGVICKRAGRTALMAEPFWFEKENGVRIEVALVWSDANRELFVSFANGIPTSSGGTHEQGARDGVTKALRTYVDTHELQPRGLTLTAEDIREGVVAVTSVFLAEPQFQGQTKEKLNNPEIRGQVDSALRTAFEQFLNQNRSVADVIVTRIIQAARARVASKQAEEGVRRKSATSHRLNLPGKLADCASSDASASELFIVEGDSAGGSAKQGRDRETQAILPLRGKVLNAEQATLKKVLENQELANIVSALGCGIGKDFDVARLRYHKIILLMDADSDGHHIATLLLTFFYRYMPQLIEGGFLFLAQPPLYRIDVGQQTWWAGDDREKERILKRLPPRAQPEITRFKGLGEMMAKTLFETTMDPRKRRLLRVTIPPGERADTENTISELMGKDAAPRYHAIMEYKPAEAGELDV
ncbi:MAG: DNA gyrase/topoisomerase IV subunit B [Myxococcota bacterium]